MTIQERLKHLRENKGKSQKEIAKVLGTTAQHYGKYELGLTEIPLDRAVKLAEYYKVSLDYLAGRTDIKHPESPLSSVIEQLSHISDEDIAILAKTFTELSDNRKEPK